jgi:hypothetical protein
MIKIFLESPILIFEFIFILINSFCGICFSSIKVPLAEKLFIIDLIIKLLSILF